MSPAASIPGLYYTFVAPPAEKSPLRTDVAGFFGRTVRGPIGLAIRVTGWREYVNVFGDLDEGMMTPYALRGYFENGGRAAHIVRLLGGGSQPAWTTWTAGCFDTATGNLDADWPGASGLAAIQYRIEATSPGDWANGTFIEIRLWTSGRMGQPEIELDIIPPNQQPEFLTGIDPGSISEEVAAQSAYIRIAAMPLPPGLAPVLLGAAGPRYRTWTPPRLGSGLTIPPSRSDYLAAVQSLGDEPEVALVASPDLHAASASYGSDGNSILTEADRIDVLAALLIQAEQLHDRLVIIDVPPDLTDSLKAVSWVDGLRLHPELGDEAVLRNAAVYHPRLRVPDPLGGVAAPLRCVASCGHVAGVISRLDGQLGAYYTPANASIMEALDLSQSIDAADQAILYAGGINLLRCSPGRGLLVWGGRVLGLPDHHGAEGRGTQVGLTPPGGFIAHRRLVHVLVRAIRAVAEPLVFSTNGPELWLAFVRSITTVLLEAFWAGALKGATPEQAFKVTCDATINGPDEIDQGVVLCLIQVAPAVPMEFITLRVQVSANGQLEVFES
ncbi:phage tail sheath C-terminal domain-containing protein [Paraburkholderia sp. BR14374]|uniref:phage tail sheath C-terminal domain-containing protein n=1 Tax=Paraburkholderia sp. BR14374 TaxID=3237007 RepID=UPI0034CD54FE